VREVYLPNRRRPAQVLGDLRPSVFAQPHEVRALAVALVSDEVARKRDVEPGCDRNGLRAANQEAVVAEQDRARERRAVRSEVDERYADRPQPRECFKG